jgi:hypothetical protein
VRTRGLIATYLLALALPLLESVWPRVALARGAQSALAWLFANAMLTYPRAAAVSGSSFGSLRRLALLLPVLGLTLGLDLARGLIEPVRAAWMTLAFAALLVAWSGLAEWAATSERRRARYREVWLCLVPGLAALALALAWVPRGAGDGPAARFWALSPLVLAQRAALPDGFAERSVVEFLAAFCGVALAAAFVASAPREERA